MLTINDSFVDALLADAFYVDGLSPELVVEIDVPGDCQTCIEDSDHVSLARRISLPPNSHPAAFLVFSLFERQNERAVLQATRAPLAIHLFLHVQGKQVPDEVDGSLTQTH